MIKLFNDIVRLNRSSNIILIKVIVGKDQVDLFKETMVIEIDWLWEVFVILPIWR